MPRQVLDYDPPDRFVAGTVGPPGQRTFFLQARSSKHVTSVSLEKAQASALAERVNELLDEVVRRSAGKAPVPEKAPADVEDTAPLDTPIEEEFRVGTMSLSWDIERHRVVIECYAEGVTPAIGAAEGDEGPATDASDSADGADDGPMLRVHLSGVAARAFAKRTLAVVAAGRPPCPFCSNPLDLEGHICPRANGYRR